MGHVRLGILPASRKWKEVVALLTDGDSSYEEIAALSAEAAEKALGGLTKDPVFIEALWLLCKIPQAAKADNFTEALRELGVNVGDRPTLAELAEGFSKAIDTAIRGHHGKQTDFSELSRKAGISSLIAMTQDALPQLWNNHSAEDVRHAVGHYAAPEHFGALAQDFFSRFTERHLRYYLDREMPKHVGGNKYLPSLSALDSFNTALHSHCQESSTIMRVFARDWYGKQYSKNEPVTRDGVKKFSHVTLLKMRKELKLRSAAHE